MGTCYTKEGTQIPLTGNANQGTCFAAGGYRWSGQAGDVINTDYPCSDMTSCNGKSIWKNPNVGARMCGPGNKMIQCVASPTGGKIESTDIPCNEGVEGSCPTHCGSFELCDGDRVDKTPIGESRCGKGNVTYQCTPSGEWSAVGGTCTCMTVCPDMPTCDGDAKLQKPGARVCGADRKTRVCEANLIGAPTWGYGPACACPGDEPTVAAARPIAPSGPAHVVARPPVDNTMLFAVAGIVLLMIIIAIVVVLIALRKKAPATGKTPVR